MSNGTGTSSGSSRYRYTLVPVGNTVVSSTTAPSASTTSPASTFARARSPNRASNSATTETKFPVAPLRNRTRAGPSPSRGGSGACLTVASTERHRLEDLRARLGCRRPQRVRRFVVGLGLR